MEIENLAGELAGLFSDYSDIANLHRTSNPLLRLGLEIGNRLESGALDYPSLERLVQLLTMQGFACRADRLARYFGETDPDRNAELIRDLMRRQTETPDGELRPFEEFRDWLQSDPYGVVITAHPTFEISSELMGALSTLATGRDQAGKPVDAAERARILEQAGAKPHGPEKQLNLKREQELALQVLGNIQTALQRIHRIALEIASEAYPERWAEITPLLMTVASWVGFDIDGRSDIGWTHAFERRLEGEAQQLNRIAATVAQIQSRGGGEDFKLTLDLISSRVARALGDTDTEAETLIGFDPSAPEAAATLRRFARRVYEGRGGRLDSAAPLIALLNRAIRLAGEDSKLVCDLVTLRAELANFGLATSHTHARINATQLHNAIRKAVGLEATPDDARNRQSYIHRINDLIAGVEPVTINFGSLTTERTSSKRLFMTMAQILKYVDSGTPIRLLIAECESAFTVLTALYFAKLFGIADKVEICPLFETEKALQQGSRVIEQLLDNPHFTQHLKAVGKLCVQTGYSDAGRYIGQTPASGSIERLKERIVRLFDKRGFTGIQLVFFDTHGESIGRGGHPDGFGARLDYVAPPALISSIRGRGIPFKQETSFQGGDGYLYFQSETGAFAALTRILEWCVADRSAAASDIYYQDRDNVTEFLTTVKAFQAGLMADSNYGLVVGTYGANLLYTIGSRAIRREGESIEAAPRPQISEFRAIPHNAVLQQLGLLANSIGGVGEAIERNPTWFQLFQSASPRFDQMISLIGYGAAMSNPDALDAYLATLGPGLWLTRAAGSHDGARAGGCRRIADMLEEWDINDGQRKVYRRLYRDFVLLRDGLKAAGRIPDARVPDETNVALTLLHAVRIAVIHQLYLLATQIPEFSSRHDIANRRIFQRVLQLDIPTSISMLRRIFPSTPETPPDTDFGEPATYVSDAAQTYQRENDQIFTPMLSLYDLIPRISIAIIHYIGALG